MICKCDLHKLETVFQPIVNLQDNSTIGYEALSRVNGKNIEALICDARQNNYINALDMSMCHSALRQANRLTTGKKIFVNVDTIAGCLVILEAVKKDLLPADSIVIEITERAVITEKFRKVVRCMKSIGMQIGLDDFGVGTSNASRLLELEPQYIKLSSTLTAELIVAKNSRIIVRSMVCLSKKIGFSLIVEGIENSDQLRILQILGVQYGQGYFLGKPA